MSIAAPGGHRSRGDSEARQDARRVIEAALGDLHGALAGLHGALVASVDGLPMAHSLRSDDPAAVAAMAATVAGLAKRITHDMALGGFAESVVRGDHGYLAVYSAGPMAVLAALASEGANLGRVHLEARRCAARIAAALNAPGDDPERRP